MFFPTGLDIINMYTDKNKVTHTHTLKGSGLEKKQQPNKTNSLCLSGKLNRSDSKESKEHNTSDACCKPEDKNREEEEEEKKKKKK